MVLQFQQAPNFHVVSSFGGVGGTKATTDQLRQPGLAGGLTKPCEAVQERTQTQQNPTDVRPAETPPEGKRPHTSPLPCAARGRPAPRRVTAPLFTRRWVPQTGAGGRWGGYGRNQDWFPGGEIL